MCDMPRRKKNQTSTSELKPPQGGAGPVAIYHVMRAREGFEETAEKLVDLVRHAQQNHPGKPRALFLDIEGHRNKAGGYDHDALELQKEFCLGFLMDYLTELHVPLIEGKRTDARGPQRDDLPDEFAVTPAPADRSLQGKVMGGLKPREFATMLGVDTRTVLRMIDEGRLDALDLSSADAKKPYWIIPEEAVEAFLAKTGRQPKRAQQAKPNPPGNAADEEGS